MCSIGVSGISSLLQKTVKSLMSFAPDLRMWVHNFWLKSLLVSVFGFIWRCMRSVSLLLSFSYLKTRDVVVAPGFCVLRGGICFFLLGFCSLSLPKYCFCSFGGSWSRP